MNSITFSSLSHLQFAVGPIRRFRQALTVSLILASSLTMACNSMAAEAGTPTQPAKPGRSGEAVYNFSCINCHAYGMAGSPKTGDKAAWAPRLVKGTPVLVTHVVNGYGGMPQKGTCTTCSEAELRAAVDYMLAKLR